MKARSRSQLFVFTAFYLWSGVAQAGPGEDGLSLNVLIGENASGAAVRNAAGEAPGVDLSRSVTTAIGAGARMDFAEKYGLSVDAISIRRQSEVPLEGGLATLESGYLQVPVLFRYRPLKLLSFGIGGYFASAQDEVKWGEGDNQVEQGLEEAGLEDSDIGLSTALTLQIPLGEHLSVLLEGRYQMGLQNLISQPDEDSSLRYRDLQSFIGLNYAF